MSDSPSTPRKWPPWPSDRVIIEVSLDALSDDDLEAMAADAYALGGVYETRDRHAPASAMFTLSDFAVAELEDRKRGANASGTTYWSSPVEFDPTSPPEHNKDDLGVLPTQVVDGSPAHRRLTVE